MNAMRGSTLTETCIVATGFSSVFLFIDVEPVIIRTLVEGLARLNNILSIAKAGDLNIIQLCTLQVARKVILTHCAKFLYSVFVVELENQSHCFSTGQVLHPGSWHFQYPTSRAIW